MGYNSGFFVSAVRLTRIVGNIEFMCSEACRARVMQSIVLLIVLLCFQVKLDWFTAAVQLCRSKWPCVEVCRAISSSNSRKSAVYTSRTLKTVEWHAKESLGELSLRSNAVETRFQVAYRTVLPSLADVCKLGHICSSGVFYSATLTGRSSLATLWKRIGSANWPSKSHLLRPWNRSQTLACQNIRKSWNENPLDRIEQGEPSTCSCTNWK